MRRRVSRAAGRSQVSGQRIWPGPLALLYRPGSTPRQTLVAAKKRAILYGHAASHAATV